MCRFLGGRQGGEEENALGEMGKTVQTKGAWGMGFRDLATFNRALLAKQVWRMMQKPQSLVARVFKARYFKDGNILTAQVKANCSFVWRSLMWSNGIVEKGMRWRVGNGQSIMVYGDRWVNGLQGGKLEFRGDGTPPLMRVAELIKDGRDWDAEMIDEKFLCFESTCVLNTPIGERGQEDEVFWQPELKGNFTVKTAYLLEMGYYDIHPHTSSTERKLWSKLVWSTSIPPKTRVFLWRAFMNYLPTAANLKEHHVPTEGECEMCRDRWATTEHALLFCPRICHIWHRSRFWNLLKKGKMLEMVDIARAV